MRKLVIAGAYVGAFATGFVLGVAMTPLETEVIRSIEVSAVL